MHQAAQYKGNDKLLFGIIPGVLAFWLFAQTILNINVDMAAACIMPASLALLKSYWEGPDRQRAVSLWSIGSWGGSGDYSHHYNSIQDRRQKNKCIKMKRIQTLE